MKQLAPLTAIALLTAVVLFACKKDLNTTESLTANAGPDQTILIPKDSVLLDASASTGNIKYYNWVKVAGPVSANISNPNLPKTSATALYAGVYQFVLTVANGAGLAVQDTVQVTVKLDVVGCGEGDRTKVNAQLVPVGTLSQARLGMAVAAAGGKVFFAGGFAGGGTGGVGVAYGHSRNVDILDISTQTFSTADLSEARSSIAAVASGSQVFFAGGDWGDGTEPIDNVDIYNISTNTWTVSHLSKAGSMIAAAAVVDKVLFAGGDGGFMVGHGRETTVDIFNLATNTWSTKSLSGWKRGGHVAVTANNKVYIAGGEVWVGNNYYQSNVIEIFDNSSNTWSTTTMREGRWSPGGIFTGGKLYWAGGVTGGSTTSHASCLVEVQDVNTNSTVMQHLSAPAVWYGNEGQNVVEKNGKLLFIGDHQPSTNNFDIYDLASNTWSIGVLPFKIEAASIISVNNIVYMAGGMVNGVLSNKVYRLEF